MTQVLALPTAVATELAPSADGPVGRPAPARTSPMTRHLERLRARHAQLTSGAIATYIPELAKADPAWFGIALMTVDGTAYEAGDARQPFSIQSISKPLTYSLGLDDLGDAAVRRWIGVEPTGEAFNSITLAPGTGTPLNPMVNSGAIVAASLIEPRGGRSPLERIVEHTSAFAGRQLVLDGAVFESERATGHRNRAIAHLLRASGALAGDPDEVLERYFAQCAISIDARDLATIAATLANNGMNPLTGERVASPASVRAVLSVMTSCGMYDGAGDWLFSVGLPAKSGVSGGILAVVPGQLGIGVFSPLLDDHGNSARGVAVCRDLARDLDLHVVGRGRARVSPIRSSRSVAQISSKRLRDAEQRSVLKAAGSGAEVRELQGELTFLAAEFAARGIADGDHPARWTVLDLRHVEHVETGVAAVLADLVAAVHQDGREIVLSGTDRVGALIAQVDDRLVADGLAPVRTFADIDRAREWCEDQVIEASLVHAPPEAADPKAEPELTQGMDTEMRQRLLGRMHRVCYAPGTQIVRRGDVAERLFLIASGQLSVTLERPGGSQRLATLSAGMVFGELSLIGRERRTADVYADTMVECLVLDADEFEAMTEDDPALACAVLVNLLRIVGQTARRMTNEVALLSA